MTVVGWRGSTLAASLAAAAYLALAGGPESTTPDPASAGAGPPLVEPGLLAQAEELGERRAPSAPSRLAGSRQGDRPGPRPHGPAQRRFERRPRMCMVAERCPSEPCVQFVGRVPRDERPSPACDRFPDPGDARMLPLARP